MITVYFLAVDVIATCFSSPSQLELSKYGIEVLAEERKVQIARKFTFTVWNLLKNIPLCDKAAVVFSFASFI